MKKKVSVVLVSRLFSGFSKDRGLDRSDVM